MKRLEQIENLSMEDLYSIAEDESIAVPESLERKIRKSLPLRINWKQYAGIAAGLLFLCGIGFGSWSYSSSPKDSFDDPEQAYAYLMKTFSQISEPVQKGKESVASTEALLAKPSQIINKTIKQQ